MMVEIDDGVHNSFHWKNIHVITNNEEKRVLLRDVSGRAYSGELTAIMGQSGSGKTTLLDALTFQTDNSSLNLKGYRYGNGKNVPPNFLNGSSAAYVRQDNSFISTLTVRDHLNFHAKLKLDRKVNDYESLIDKILLQLNLNDVQNNKIYFLSQGEKKRLSIAAEMISSPEFLFLDEPTSGLDSTMAEKVIQCLKQIAVNHNIAIILTIHQPSTQIFEQFDRLILISRGRIAFEGNSISETLDFFENVCSFIVPAHYNPADFYMDIISTNPTIPDLFEQSDYKVKLDNVFNRELKNITVNYDVLKYEPSFWSLLNSLLKRSWRSIDMMIIKSQFIFILIINMLLGIIYYGQENNQEGIKNINGAIFLMIVNHTYDAALPTVFGLGYELPIIFKEKKDGLYSPKYYLISRYLAYLPLESIISIIKTTIMYWMVGLNPDPLRYLQALMIFWLLHHVVSSFASAVTCIAGKNKVLLANNLTTGSIVLFMIFGGFFLTNKSIPKGLTWVKFISWFSVTNEALMINQWSDVHNITCGINGSTNCLENGFKVLDNLSLQGNNYLYDLGIMIAMIFIYKIISIVSLIVSK